MSNDEKKKKRHKKVTERISLNEKIELRMQWYKVERSLEHTGRKWTERKGAKLSLYCELHSVHRR